MAHTGQSLYVSMPIFGCRVASVVCLGVLYPDGAFVISASVRLRSGSCSVLGERFCLPRTFRSECSLTSLLLIKPDAESTEKRRNLSPAHLKADKNLQKRN